MSKKEKKKEKKMDWSLKELSETERNNLLGFFALLLKVDRRVNPHLYANNGNTNHAYQAE
jgi:hypothetical protein